MTYEELVEKVAERIRARRDGFGCAPWGQLHDAHKKPYWGDASVAIATVAEALAGPPPEMRRAMFSGDGVAYDGSDAARQRAGVAFLAYEDALRASPLFPPKAPEQAKG